jgi:DNA (cytosine-5)-methyltransferase 1
LWKRRIQHGHGRNHWDVAIATHSLNHPGMRHLCAEVDRLRDGELSDNGRLDLIWASPSCTEHSYAKGGKSIDDQNRVSAWAVVREAERYRPKVVIVENVRNFLKWGPVEPVFHRNGKPKLDKVGEHIYRPIASKKGETFRAWFAAIESLGYSGKWELLNAADYGEPQTRLRLFVVFVARGLNYQFPAPTHGRPGTLSVERGIVQSWVPARDIIDFELASQSIFERSKPLSPNTMRRIETGIRRYCSGVLAEAFLVVLRRNADAQSLDDAVPTIVASGNHIGLAEVATKPYIVNMKGQSNCRDIDSPVPTLTAHAAHLYLAEPEAFVCGNRTNNVPRGLDDPLPTVTTAYGGGAFLAEPHLIDVRHGDSPHRPRSIDEPLGTVCTKNGVGMVEPFIASYAERDGDGSGKTASVPKSVNEPLATVITRDRFGLVEPFIVPAQGQGTKALDEPLPTVTAGARGVRFIEPFLAAHFGEGPSQSPRTHSLDDPAPTVTGRGAGDLVVPTLTEASADAPADRVVEIDGKLYVLDIKFRMLQPSELARAQGFPSDYQFSGTKSDRTAQIGNAVPVSVAYALMKQALTTLFGPMEAAA